VVRRPAQPAQTATSAWSSHTETQSRTAPVVTGAVAAKPEGRYRIQVGLVRTQREADALAARVKQEHGSLLGARDMEIDQAVVGNMGSLYRVRVGPFATQQETNVICARLKGTGLDCLVVAQ
jgi:cell division protein FtsN